MGERYRSHRVGDSRDAGDHGRDAVGVFGGGSLTNEKAYLLGKFARVALGTSNIDYNGRFCMSSAAAGASKALGLDRGLPFPLEDIPHAEVILLVGGNMAETMPPIMRYFEAQQRNGGSLIVADPRRSATAQWAKLHLALRPGSDAALANGLVHLLIRESLIDPAYIESRTEGFDEVRRLAAAYWPERVEPDPGDKRCCNRVRRYSRPPRLSRRPGRPSGKHGWVRQRSLDRRGMAVLSLGHLSVDLCQGALPALLPFLIAEHGLFPTRQAAARSCSPRP